jgi:hypothetical protein
MILATLLKALPMRHQRAAFFGLQKQLRSVLAGDLFQQDPHVRCGLFSGGRVRTERADRPHRTSPERELHRRHVEGEIFDVLASFGSLWGALHCNKYRLHSLLIYRALASSVFVAELHRVASCATEPRR